MQSLLVLFISLLGFKDYSRIAGSKKIIRYFKWAIILSANTSGMKVINGSSRNVKHSTKIANYPLVAYTSNEIFFSSPV